MRTARLLFCFLTASGSHQHQMQPGACYVVALYWPLRRTLGVNPATHLHARKRALISADFRPALD